MLRKALDYIKVNNMIEKGDRIVIGVSGGADSVCLLYVLGEYCSEQDATLIVVHINHGIRGEEAARDENFVKDLCFEKGLEFIAFSYDVKKIAKEQGLSEEEAGRMVRYNAFLEICKKNKCNKIAIAHNKNDNAETVLFHLIRGSGLKGLTGIEPKRIIKTDFGEVTMIRPLLCIERGEIEDYLSQKGIMYQTDSTNNTDDYSRNKIRNKILKYAVREINNGTIGNITETANQLREVQEYINDHIGTRYLDLVEKKGNVYHISATALMKESRVIQKGIILRIMDNLAGKLKDIEAKHVDAVLSLLDKQVGRYRNLPYSMIAERDYEEIKLYNGSNLENMESGNGPMDPVNVNISGGTIVVQKRKIFETSLINYKNNETIPKSSCMKWFDYDKIENAVEIRTRKEGDYIQINSSGGSKKLKDYFIDRKIPKKLRDSQILIADGNHIMWIPDLGDRMSERYKVSHNTTRVLVMKMLDMEDNLG